MIQDTTTTTTTTKDESAETTINATNKTDRLKKLLKPDTYMLPAKICYFFTVAQDGAFKPYMLPFFIGIGLSQAEAGFVTGVRLLGMIVAGPLWGLLTDKRQNHVQILILLAMMSIVLNGGQPLLSLLIGNKNTNICPYVKPATSQNSSYAVKEAGKRSLTIDYGSSRFLVLLLVNILASCFDGCMASLVDAGVVKRINISKTQKNFGWNRLFGAVGFSAGSLFSGFVSDVFPDANVNCFTGAFVVYVFVATGTMVTAPFLFKFPSGRGVQGTKKQKVKIASLKSTLLKTLCQFEVVLFFSTVFIMGILQSVYISFTALLLRELQSPTYLIGLTISIAAISCVPTLSFGSRLIGWFRGIWNTLFLCCASYAIRFIAFGYIENPWLAIPINLLQTFGFGLYLVTAVLYVKSASTPAIYTTMYSIMNTIFYGIGFITANIVGSQIFGRFGGRVLFTVCGLLAVCWSLILFCYIVGKRHRKKNQVDVSPPEEKKDIVALDCIAS